MTPISNASNLRPRVLHVLEATLGGTLRYLRDIIRTLSSDKFEIALACSSLRADPGFGPALDEAREHGWQIFPLEMVRVVSPFQDLRSARHLRQILSTFRPQIVHCHSSKAGALGRIASIGMSPRPRIIYSPHAIAANLGLQYLVAERLLAPLTDRFGAVSDSERNEIVNLGLATSSKVDVIYPFIDSEFYGPRNRADARAALGLPDDASVIIGVGRLTEQKDPLKFVEIIRRVANESDAIKAVWLGDGELREAMTIEIRRAGLEGVVELPGWQPEMRPWFAAADLLLSTSKYESFGYMVAEALAMERPVVATSIPGTSDIMDGELKGLIYPTGSTSAAAERILTLLRNPLEAGKIGRLGRSTIMSNFTSARMTHSLARCYATLIAKPA